MTTKIYQCPFCSETILETNQLSLTCSRCGKKYAIKNNFPIFVQNDVIKSNQTILLYREVHSTFSSRKIGKFIKFMNMGLPADDKNDFELAQKATINKNSIRLLCRLICEYDLNNKRVLELGCGRCGNLELISALYNTSNLCGVDISYEGFEFVNLNKHANFNLCVSDLNTTFPYRSSSFDFVYCIEVVRHIVNIQNFFQEVYRIIDTGQLCVADILDRDLWIKYIDCAVLLGFKVIRNIDVTDAVIQSLNAVTPNRINLFGVENINMIGVSGSKLYNDMVQRKNEYRLLTLQK